MFRSKYLLGVLCTLFPIFCQAEWTTSDPKPISEPYSSFTNDSVFSSCNPATGQFLATWVDGNNNDYPTYSFFSPGTGWGPINTISSSADALHVSNVFTSCDPVSGKFLATWTKFTGRLHQPTASVYIPGTGWSTADLLNDANAAVNTTNSFDSTTGQFLVTWADAFSSHFPMYSFYTPSIGWGPISTISTDSLAANVYTTFDPTTDQFLAVWADIATGFPMYSFYAAGAWSTDAPISSSASVQNDVLCACNPSTGIFIATWADINQQSLPFYSIYTPGSGWSPAATITTSSGVGDNVAVSCDLSTGQFLASWSDVLNGQATYSFYTPGTGWSIPAIISPLSNSASDIITCFNSTSGQFLATWADNSNPDQIFNPTYSFFTNILPPPPPSHFVGTVVRNRFLTQTEIVHKLVWSPPGDSTLIVSYQISRNGVVIAVVPASGPFTYYDHNRNNNSKDIYTIVSINADGKQSTPSSIIL